MVCLLSPINITGWWFQTFFIFHHLWDVILPIDFHIFQDDYCTTNQISSTRNSDSWNYKWYVYYPQQTSILAQPEVLIVEITYFYRKKNRWSSGFISRWTSRTSWCAPWCPRWWRAKTTTARPARPARWALRSRTGDAGQISPVWRFKGCNVRPPLDSVQLVYNSNNYGLWYLKL